MNKPYNTFIPGPGPKEPCPPPASTCCDYPPPATQCPGPIPPNCNPPIPPCPPNIKPIAPVPSVLEGSSLYEAMSKCVERVNLCIGQWNAISGNCFAAMNACVEAARSNDVYYDDCEVGITDGYSTEDACAYTIVAKKAVDRNGNPIRVRLAPAYNNATNSGLKQKIYDVSRIKSANVIMTAVDPSQTTWYGPAMWQGAPIAGTNPAPSEEAAQEDAETQYWVYGFDNHGILKFFSTEATTLELQQNGMSDVIGGCTPLVEQGAVTESAEALTIKSAIGAIGWRASDGMVFFLTCSGQDNPGMRGITVANTLRDMGCTTAVATYIIPATNLNESAGMLYMAQMCDVPQGGLEPDNLAYWYISKEPCFKNRFQKEVADLVQVTGQNTWRIYLSHVELEALSERVQQNHEDILAEIERASQAEQDLKQDITDETNRAVEAEKMLQDNINAEQERAMAAEAMLQENINKEIERAEAAEKQLQDNIDAEQARAEAAEKQLQDNIDAEQARAEAAETQLQDNIDAEQARAEAAEKQLQDNIDAEQARAEAAETTLQNNIDKETARAEAAEQALKESIQAEKERAIAREDQLQEGINDEVKARIDADNDLINAIEQETLARKAADAALTTKIEEVDARLGGQISKNVQEIKNIWDELAKINGDVVNINGDIVKLTEATTQIETNMQALKDQLVSGALELPYLKLTGGTLSGPVNFDSTDTVTVGRGPTEPMEVATKQYVDDAVATGGGGGTGGDVSKEYVDQQISAVQSQLNNKVSKTGDTMTGALNMSDNKVTGLATPTEPTDAASKSYVDDEIDVHISEATEGIFLPISGGTMEGNIDIKTTSTKGIGIQFKNDTILSRILDWADALRITRDTGAIHIISPLNRIVGQTNIEGNLNIQEENKISFLTYGNISHNDTGLTINGANTIDHNINGENPPDIELTDDTVNVKGPLKVLNTLKEALGNLFCGLLNIGGIVLQPHNSTGSTATHLDINVPSDVGAVYINRAIKGPGSGGSNLPSGGGIGGVTTPDVEDDGEWETVEGGTGELWVTEVHSPQELRFNPGTVVNFMNKIAKGFLGIFTNNIYFGTDTSAPNIQSTGSGSNSYLFIYSLNADTGLTMGQKRIINVAPGVNDNDAATVAQVKAAGGATRIGQASYNNALSVELGVKPSYFLLIAGWYTSGNRRFTGSTIIDLSPGGSLNISIAASSSTVINASVGINASGQLLASVETNGQNIDLYLLN